MELTEKEIMELAMRLADVNLRYKELKDRKAELAAQLRAALKPGTNRDYGNVHVTIGNPRLEFDPAKALLLCTPEQIAFATVTETRIDPDKLKSILAPAAYTACCSETSVASVNVK